MNKQINTPYAVPTAHIAVNKSRLKLYNKSGEMPTYYLQAGTEFQIELFNPTSDVVLAKISLNGNVISQGGLVLNPGQRVFLDRYLDVAKKFLFDTYEVANTAAVKEAIKNNGDFKVEFFRETKPYFTFNYNKPSWVYTPYVPYSPSIGTPWGTTCTTRTGGSGTLTASAFYSNAGAQSSNVVANSATYSCDSIPTMDMAQGSLSKNLLRSKKSIETGRVEKGSDSDQTFKYVDKTFDSWAFQTIECKMLPISQKINTSADVNVKRFCRDCGAKLGKTDRFCSKCGHKS